MPLLTLNNARGLHNHVIRAGTFSQSGVLLFIRLAWGWQLLESGYGHLTHVQNTLKFFTDLGIPFPLANVYISGSTELIGGALLMLGLASRYIALPLLFNFCVAYATDARDAIKHIFTDPDQFINYAAFPFLVTALLIFAFGPGWFSLDTIIQWALKREPNRPKAEPALHRPGMIATAQ